ncbi:MAG: cyclic nucleotide-binding domain-containing protein, partial [Rhodospirillaceae bacterium]
DAMYFIATGDVEVDLINAPPRHLSDGDFFGEIGVMMNRKRTATVTAITETRLMVLEAADMLRLMAEHEFSKPTCRRCWQCASRSWKTWASSRAWHQT